MSKKKKEKGNGMSGGDVLLTILIVLLGGVFAVFTVAAAGSFLSQDGGQAAADQTSIQTVQATPSPNREPIYTAFPAQPTGEPSQAPEPTQSGTGSYRVPDTWTARQANATATHRQQTATAPSMAPAPSSTPASSNAPVQSNVPAATPSQAPAPVPSRAQPTQTPAPSFSAQSAQPVQQSQKPTQAGNQGGSTVASRNNWPTGKFLGSVLRDKYHSHNCQAAANILPENERWFDSEDEARTAGYSRCGICWR